MKKISILVIGIAVILSSMGLMAFVSISPAMAAQAAPTRTPRVDGKQVDQELTFTLQREQNWLQRQTLQLNKVNTAVNKAQELIDQAQANGKDVTDLTNALAAFTTQIAAAQASHDQAASLLNAKNGFDENNQVVNRQAAHQTLLDSRNALREAHLTLQQGILTFRTAVQQWRTAQRAQ